MFSKRSRESYLLIDHSMGEGITPEQAASAGKNTIPVARGQRLETAVRKCSHCETQIVLNPKRNRPSNYCPKCDWYLCDSCELIKRLTGECRSMERQIDEIINRAAKGLVT